LRIKNPDLDFNQQRIVKCILAEAGDYAQILAVLFKQTSKSKMLLGSSLENNSESEIEKARNHLIKNLQRRLDKDLERIFHLLGLRYSLDDIYSVYQGIKSSKNDLQINAVEYLDNVLEIDLKRVIIPLVETTLVGALVDETLERFDLKVPSQFECLIMLLTGEDRSLQMDALNLISHLKDDRYLRHIGQLINSPDTKIKRLAIRVLHDMDFTV
jgi:AAA family ATP:ADP antiporter